MPFKKVLWSCWGRIADRAARSYILGSELKAALQACRRMTGRFVSTIGYWNTEDESSQHVAETYLEALDVLGKEHLDAILSIKAPALKFDRSWLSQVFDRAQRHDGGLHDRSRERRDVPSRRPGLQLPLAARERGAALGVPPRLDAVPGLAAAPHRRGADGRVRLLARLPRPPGPRAGKRVRDQGDLLDRALARFGLAPGAGAH